jgi:hypothetical protein
MNCPKDKRAFFRLSARFHMLYEEDLTPESLAEIKRVGHLIGICSDCISGKEVIGCAEQK